MKYCLRKIFICWHLLSNLTPKYYVSEKNLYCRDVLYDVNAQVLTDCLKLVTECRSHERLFLSSAYRIRLGSVK
jgi:hypothetical protein